MQVRRDRDTLYRIGRLAYTNLESLMLVPWNDEQPSPFNKIDLGIIIKTGMVISLNSNIDLRLNLKFTKGFVPIESHDEIGYYFATTDGAYAEDSKEIDPWKRFYKGAFVDDKEVEDKTTTQTLGFNIGINYNFKTR